MRQVISGWGRYPFAEAEVVLPNTASEAAAALAGRKGAIARGQGRSYGDSSLQSRVVGTARLDRFLAFDESAGEITCEAGVTLAQMLDLIVPKGLFLPVTPGTQYVSVGGAIASDVHGKNHHLDGCFSNFVSSIDILLGNGEVVRASPSEHRDLFLATCGGMGLTGIILRATLQLRRIRSSSIDQSVVRTGGLEETLEAFQAHHSSTYSVAWIDCLARGRRLGRSILMFGEHADGGTLDRTSRIRTRIRMTPPAGLLNRATVGAFNELYYRSARLGRMSIDHVDYFYPLDAIEGWNRLYGRNGFVQYQFVVPRTASSASIRQIISLIADSGLGSFLAVLKALGPANASPLSFPMEGYTLALDFKATDQTLRLLARLDSLVAEQGGRVYLTKDARMSAQTFRQMYPHWARFEQVRASYHAPGAFWSMQSRRLGLS